MSRVRIRSQAKTEIRDASDWYERQSPGLGTEFVLAVDKALLAIVDQPRAFSPIGKGARRLLMQRFPYSIIYGEERSSITIYSCFHNHRDPRHWQKRL
jgi:plasmid stabilization system protein ParE